MKQEIYDSSWISMTRKIFRKIKPSSNIAYIYIYMYIICTYMNMYKYIYMYSNIYKVSTSTPAPGWWLSFRSSLCFRNRLLLPHSHDNTDVVGAPLFKRLCEGRYEVFAQSCARSLRSLWEVSANIKIKNAQQSKSYNFSKHYKIWIMQFI